MMENPRPEKVAVVDEVREQAGRCRRRAADRVPRPDRQAARRAATAAAPGRRRVQDLQEHPRALRRPRGGGRPARSPADGPDGHHLRPRRRGRGGQAAARLRQGPPGPRGEGRAARRQGRLGQGRRGAGRPAAARRPAGPARRSLPGPDGQAGRPAAGPAPELRLRPGRPHRPARRTGGSRRARDRSPGDRSRRRPKPRRPTPPPTPQPPPPTDGRTAPAEEPAPEAAGDDTNDTGAAPAQEEE